jgi:hypothetical protein
MGEHHHPALVLHHLTHPAHPLKAAFSTNGNNEGWADIHTIYLHTYIRQDIRPRSPTARVLVAVAGNIHQGSLSDG